MFNISLDSISNYLIQKGFKLIFILSLVFIVDSILTILVKVFLFRISSLQITDLLIPGLIAGVGMRLLHIVFGLGFTILYFVTGVLFTHTLDSCLQALSVVLLDLIQLVFVDILGFLSTWFTQYDPLRFADMIISLLLNVIQTFTHIPVYDLYNLGVQAFIQMFAPSSVATSVATDFMITFVQFVVGLVIGAVSYPLIDLALGAFTDFADARGYLKGDEISPNVPYRLVNKDDIVQTNVITSTDRMGNEVQIGEKGFISNSAKALWAKIWTGEEKMPPHDITTLETEYVYDPVDPDYVGFDEGTGEYVTREVTTTVYDAPYLTEEEKESILSKIRSRVYDFLSYLRVDPPE